MKYMLAFPSKGKIDATVSLISVLKKSQTVMLNFLTICLPINTYLLVRCLTILLNKGVEKRSKESK